MGGAVAESLRGSGYALTVTAASTGTLAKIREKCPEADCTFSNPEAVKDADIVVIALKPYVAPGVIEEIIPSLKEGALIVSMVAGLSLEALNKAFKGDVRRLTFFRVIPNTAIRHGKSVTFISHDADGREPALEEIREIFSRSGKVFVIPEKDMAACTALASCGIAYFLRFIRAAAEGGVELGLRPGFATEVAAYTAEGAAALLKNGSHPEVEIDKVTTPGGITIRGLNEMEKHGLTTAVIAGIKASI